MNVISITLFVIMMWGYGFTISYFSDKEGYEKHFMSLAFGIAVFTVLAALYTILRIPLSWYWFFIPSLIYPIYHFSRNKPKLNFKLKKSHIYFLVVLVLFIFTFNMYLKGAFSYELYEDGDPWRHSGIVKYISLQKTALEPLEGHDILQYVDSYPPGYDVLLSFGHQISGNLIWSVKFFNALLISLGIIFFYFFAKQLTGKKDRALFSTFVLAAIPCYMSHFIWAHSLVVVLIFPFFYCLELSSKNKKWILPSSLCYAGIALAQPTQAFKITLLFVSYFIIKSILTKKIQWNQGFSVLIGGISSILIWWGPMFVKYGGVKNTILATGTSLGVSGGSFGFKYKGTADRIYTFNDFFVAKAQNMINNPIGVGVILTLLFFFTLGYLIWKYKHLLNEKNHWVIITMGWLLITFLGIHGQRLPVQLWAFRFWMLFAIFFSLFVSVGFFAIKKLVKDKTLFYFISLLIIVGILFTSASPKWSVNTVSWEHSAGEYAQYGNLDSWKYVHNLPKDSNVFFPCRNGGNMDVSILGVDQYTCLWCEDEKNFKMSLSEKNGTEIIDFSRSKNYDYLFIDGNCLVEYNETEINQRLKDISSIVPLVHQSKGGFVWSLK